MRRRKNRHRLWPVEQELQTAAMALRAISLTQSFDECDRQWRIFLGAVAKAFKKLIGITKSSKQAKHIVNDALCVQRADPLLQYVFHARHADNHRLDEQIDLLEAGLMLSCQGSTVVKKLVIDWDGGKAIPIYEGDKPDVLLNKSPRPMLLPVENRGRTCFPPRRHLDQLISVEDSLSPIFVGEKAFVFYRSVGRKVASKLGLK